MHRPFPHPILPSKPYIFFILQYSSIAKSFSVPHFSPNTSFPPRTSLQCLSVAPLNTFQQTMGNENKEPALSKQYCTTFTYVPCKNNDNILAKYWGKDNFFQ